MQICPPRQPEGLFIISACGKEQLAARYSAVCGKAAEQSKDKCGEH